MRINGAVASFMMCAGDRRARIRLPDGSLSQSLCSKEEAVAAVHAAYEGDLIVAQERRILMMKISDSCLPDKTSDADLDEILIGQKEDSFLEERSLEDRISVTIH